MVKDWPVGPGAPQSRSPHTQTNAQQILRTVLGLRTVDNAYSLLAILTLEMVGTVPGTGPTTTTTTTMTVPIDVPKRPRERPKGTIKDPLSDDDVIFDVI